MGAGDRTTPPRSRATADKPSGDAFLRFCQGMNILRSDGTINRGEARAWINREYPNAELVLAEKVTAVLPPPGGVLDEEALARWAAEGEEAQDDATGIITEPPEVPVPGGGPTTAPAEETA